MTASDNLPFVLAIDVGTSALKAVLYAADGRPLATAVQRYDHLAPLAGWAEADPHDWWMALREALADLQAQGYDLWSIQAIGLTGQMHTPVLLDEAGQPLAPTILWLDRRAAAETAELAERLGLPPNQLNSTYTLPKLLWLHRHQPEVLARTRTLLWPKDYLRYRLTGRLLTDITEAAGAALLDWQRRTWATGRLALVGLSRQVLPDLKSAEGDAGPLRPAVAIELGLSPSARIIVGAGDVVALLGAAPPKVGRLTCSLGSSSMISCPLPPGQAVHDPAQRLYVYPFLPYPLLNGVQSTSGAALTWACRAFYGEERELDSAVEAALQTEPGADSLLFLPFLAGERSPYWRDSLRGGFYGLTLGHGRPHMLRAVLEGVAYSLRQLVDIAEELGVAVGEIALAGGGATVAGWSQIIADVCQRPVLVYTGQETVTRPIYAFCMAALDPLTTFDQALASTFDKAPRLYEPRPELAIVYDAIYARFRLLAKFVVEEVLFWEERNNVSC